MKALLLNPCLFNYVLLAPYAMNALRWALYSSWADATYWLGALIITSAVIWGYAL